MVPVVSIQARLGSSRLPGKVLLHLGEYRVIEWVYKRVTGAESTEDVIFAIGDNPENEAIAEWCQRGEHDYVTGSEDDLLERHRQALDEAGGDTLVRITADCPFVPPLEIDRLISIYMNSDARYVSNISDDMPIGTAVDIIDGELLDELADRGDSHPARAVRETPEKYETEFSRNPEWEPVKDAHIAVDTPDDYWRLTDALASVGSSPLDVAQWVSEN